MYGVPDVESPLRVAAGIDSMVVGESEILGQVRRAYQVALDEGMLPRVLGAAFRQALRVGKRARNETAIGRNPVSVSSAAVELARRAHVEEQVVEIWQTDASGAYVHTRSANRDKRDGNFQGFGRFTTGSSGEYYFRTIKPVPYPGRTPHIHVQVKHKGLGDPFTTQCYIKGEPRNDRDGGVRIGHSGTKRDQGGGSQTAVGRGAPGLLEQWPAQDQQCRRCQRPQNQVDHLADLGIPQTVHQRLGIRIDGLYQRLHAAQFASYAAS